MAERYVIIEHKQSGEQYAVTLDAYHRLYEEHGYRVLRYEDGTPYTPKSEKHK